MTIATYLFVNYSGDMVFRYTEMIYNMGTFIKDAFTMTTINDSKVQMLRKWCINIYKLHGLYSDVPHRICTMF